MNDAANEPTAPAMANARRSTAQLALLLLLTGWVLPVACWAFWLPQVLLWASCAAVLLAFALGIVAWRQRPAKFVVIGAVAFALVEVGAVRHGLPTYPLQIRPTATWMQPLASQWITQSAAKPYSIQTDSNLQEDGEDSLRFELRSGDTWVDQTFSRSYRAEVTTKDFPPAGVERWYALSVFFPRDFPIEKNRLVFAQWKEREGFLAVGLSPSLAFRFVDGQFSIRLRHSPEKVIRDADDVTEINVFKSRSFPLGQWQRFVVQAKWSCREDGLVNVWWNGRQIVEYRGPVGYDQPFAPKLKFGLYRDATEKTYVAYFNRVLTGDDAEDVRFDAATGAPKARD